MGKKKTNKILIILLILILFIVLLFPYKSTQYDGTYYYALIYTVVCKNELSVATHDSSSNTLVTKGTQIYIFKIKVFDNTQTVEYD